MMGAVADRLSWHARLAWRASRFGAIAGLVGGFFLNFLNPVNGAWLAPAVATACFLGGMGFALAARGLPLPDRGLDVGPALEKVGARDQIAHGLFRTALVLFGFSLGLVAGDRA